MLTLKCDTVCGLFYKLQATSNLADPSVNHPAGFVQCLESPALLVQSITSPRKKFATHGA